MNEATEFQKVLPIYPTEFLVLCSFGQRPTASVGGTHYWLPQVSVVQTSVTHQSYFDREFTMCFLVMVFTYLARHLIFLSYLDQTLTWRLWCALYSFYKTMVKLNDFKDVSFSILSQTKVNKLPCQ